MRSESKILQPTVIFSFRPVRHTACGLLVEACYTVIYIWSKWRSTALRLKGVKAGRFMHVDLRRTSHSITSRHRGHGAPRSQLNSEKKENQYTRFYPTFFNERMAIVGFLVIANF
jgi:hypothetical protein